MGNSDYEPISQWSKGDYAGADNRQDDFAVITGAGLSLRSDEAGNSIATAASGPPSGTAYITAATTRTSTRSGSCSGTVQVDAVGAADGANLDIELRLYRADGTQVAIANPVSAKVDANVASGLSATISTPVTAGSYVVAVDGVGRGTWNNGYDDYASVGAYTLDSSGCDGAPDRPDRPRPDPDPVVPGIPVLTSVTGGPRGGAVTASLRWNAPDDDGGISITGYRVKATRWSRGRPVYQGYLSGLTADQTSIRIGLPKAGSWSFRVQALNDVGYGVLSPPSRRVRAADRAALDARNRERAERLDVVAVGVAADLRRGPRSASACGGPGSARSATPRRLQRGPAGLLTAAGGASYRNASRSGVVHQRPAEQPDRRSRRPRLARTSCISANVESATLRGRRRRTRSARPRRSPSAPRSRRRSPGRP